LANRMTRGDGSSRYSLAAEAQAKRRAEAEREAERHRLGGAPRSARVALWLTVATVAVTALSLAVSALLLGDSYSAGFAVGYVGGPIILVGFLAALVAGLVGFVVSLREHSKVGAR